MKINDLQWYYEVNPDSSIKIYIGGIINDWLKEHEIPQFGHMELHELIYNHELIKYMRFNKPPPPVSKKDIVLTMHLRNKEDLPKGIQTVKEILINVVHHVAEYVKFKAMEENDILVV